MKLLIIGALGALGVLLRYGLSQYMPPSSFSWPVLAVNVVGSFIAGVIFTMHIAPSEGPHPWASLVLIGVLGGLTTFSSYALDTVRLLESSAWSLALLNIGLNNFLSIGACYLGVKLPLYI